MAVSRIPRSFEKPTVASMARSQNPPKQPSRGKGLPRPKAVAAKVTREAVQPAASKPIHEAKVQPTSNRVHQGLPASRIPVPRTPANFTRVHVVLVKNCRAPRTIAGGMSPKPSRVSSPRLGRSSPTASTASKDSFSTASTEATSVNSADKASVNTVAPTKVLKSALKKTTSDEANQVRCVHFTDTLVTGTRRYYKWIITARDQHKQVYTYEGMPDYHVPYKPAELVDRKLLGDTAALTARRFPACFEHPTRKRDYLKVQTFERRSRACYIPREDVPFATEEDWARVYNPEEVF